MISSLIEGIKFNIKKYDYILIFQATTPVMGFDEEKKTQYKYDLVMSDLTLYASTSQMQMETALCHWGRAYVSEDGVKVLIGVIRDHFKNLPIKDLADVTKTVISN